MNRAASILLPSALFALGTFTPISHGQEKPRKSLLAVLKEGQSVSVKESAGRYEITVLKDVKFGHKVIEIGADYVVVEDIAGVTETRIHVTSIKAIVRFRLSRE